MFVLVQNNDWFFRQNKDKMADEAETNIRKTRLKNLFSWNILINNINNINN